VKTAVLYCRVSTTAQAEQGTSLSTQLDLCRAYAKEHDYAVLAEVSEDFSGASLARPGLDRVRDMAQAGEVEAVIVYDPDRLSRSNPHMWILMEEFEGRNVELVFVNAPRENTPEGRMLFGMRALFAEYERAKILERTRRGRERRAREGRVLGTGMSPYGYRYIKGEGRFEVAPEEAAWVATMFQWYAYEGLTMGAVAKRLNELAVPTKRNAPNWTAQVVHGIVTNETYAGQWAWNKNRNVVPLNPRPVHRPGRRLKSSLKAREPAEWIFIEVPGVIEQTLFDAAKERLERNKRFSRRNTRREYLLRGLLTCMCGRKLVGNQSHGQLYYRCWTTATGQFARHVRHAAYIQAAELEERVWREVVRQLGTRELVEHHLAQMQTETCTDNEALQSQSTALQEADATLRAQENHLLEMAEHVSRDTLLKRLATLRKERAAIANQLAALQPAAPQGMLLSAEVRAIEPTLDSLVAGFSISSYEERRAFLETFNIEGQVHDDRLRLKGLPEEVDLPLKGAA
jgi:site-specific DNA recombinase